MKLELGSVFVEPTRPDLVREKGGLVSVKAIASPAPIREEGFFYARLPCQF